MVWECLGQLNERSRENPVTTLWIPGYNGMESKEAVEKLTETGAKGTWNMKAATKL